MIDLRQATRGMMFGALTVRTVRGAEIMPVEYARDATNNTRVGVYLPDGSVMAETLLRRGDAVSDPPRRQAVDVQEGDAIYGGLVFGHYGHFLVETLARYWYLREHPDQRVVWNGWRGQLEAWQQEIFALLGLPVTRDDIVVRPTRFSRLIVPAAAALIRSRIHQRQADALGVFPFREPVERRVWLSRSQLAPGHGGVDGEAKVEQLLAAEGWDVVHPETLAVGELLEQLADALVIAGFDGSAFHTLLLGRDIRARIVLVPRAPREWGTRRISDTYRHVAAAKPFQQVVVNVPLTHVSGTGARARYRTESPERVCEAVDAAASGSVTRRRAARRLR